MRGMVFCLVLVAGCASRPTTTVVAPTPSSAAMPAGAGAKPASTAGAADGVPGGSDVAQAAGGGTGALPTGGGGTKAGSVAGARVANAAPTSGAAANAAPTAGAHVVAEDAAARRVNRALVAQGYRPTEYRGQLFYCRKQKLTGSQFSQKVCLTEQEADLQERIAQDEMNKRNWGGKCLPPLCPPTK